MTPLSLPAQLARNRKRLAIARDRGDHPDRLAAWEAHIRELERLVDQEAWLDQEAGIPVSGVLRPSGQIAEVIVLGRSE